MSGPAMFARGTTLRSTLAFVRSAAGTEAADAVLARLPDAVRARVEAADPTTEVPLALLGDLWAAVEAEIGGRMPDWPERSGAFAIESLGVQLYRGILLKSSPEEFLNQRISLFRLYYHPGDMEVVEQDQGRAVLRLVGFDPGGTPFCRRQTGGLLRSVELAGGASPAVRHVRCAAEGDAFCEWELGWE